MLPQEREGSHKTRKHSAKSQKGFHLKHPQNEATVDSVPETNPFLVTQNGKL